MTVDHVDPMKPINDDKIVGHIKSAKIVDAEDDDLASVIAVACDLSDEALDAIKDGKKELSLGYLCKTASMINTTLSNTILTTSPCDCFAGQMR